MVSFLKATIIRTEKNEKERKKILCQYLFVSKLSVRVRRETELMSLSLQDVHSSKLQVLPAIDVAIDHSCRKVTTTIASTPYVGNLPI